MSNGNTSPMNRPEAFTVPDIGKPLSEVFKAGGMPLAFLFISASIVAWVLAKSFANQALPDLLLIVKGILAGSFVSFVFLSIIGYLKWRGEVRGQP